MGNNVSSLLNVTMNSLVLKPKLFSELIDTFSIKPTKIDYVKNQKVLSEMLIKTSYKYVLISSQINLNMLFLSFYRSFSHFHVQSCLRI